MAKSAEDLFNRVQSPHPCLPAGRDFACPFLYFFLLGKQKKERPNASLHNELMMIALKKK